MSQTDPPPRLYLLGANRRPWRLQLKPPLSQKGGVARHKLSPNMGRQCIWAELHETSRTFCHLGSQSAGCQGGSVGRASTRDPKTRGSNPVRGTRTHCEKSFPEPKCCADSLSVCPTPVCIRTHKNDHVRMFKIICSPCQNSVD